MMQKYLTCFVLVSLILLVSGCNETQQEIEEVPDTELQETNDVQTDGEEPMLVGASTYDADELMEIVADLALEFLHDFGIEDEGLHPTVIGEIMHSPLKWIWAVDYYTPTLPIGAIFVRVDNETVVGFKPFVDQEAPMISEPGDPMPTFIMDYLDMEYPEYRTMDWLAEGGKIIFRRYREVDGYEVGIGNVIIYFEPDLYRLMDLNFDTLEPPDEIIMNFDEQAAIEAAAGYLGDDTLTPIGTELVFVPIRIDPAIPTYFCWEVRFEGHHLYVRCDTGEVLTSGGGSEFPILVI